MPTTSLSQKLNFSFAAKLLSSTILLSLVALAIGGSMYSALNKVGRTLNDIAGSSESQAKNVSSLSAEVDNLYSASAARNWLAGGGAAQGVMNHNHRTAAAAHPDWQ